MLKKTMVAGAVALGLAGCAAPTRIPLDAAARDKLAQVRVVHALAQDEIVVRAPAAGASAAMGGGLIAAIIDSKIGEVRQNELQGTLAPFYASVDDFNFRSLFAGSLESSLREEKTLRFGAIEHAAQNLLHAEAEAQRKALPEGQGLMLGTTSYTFSPDFSRLSVATQVQLNQSGKEDPVFKNTYFYQSAPVGAGGAASLTLWADKDGARYREAARESVVQILRMLRMDLAAGAADAAPGPQLALTALGTPVNVAVKGPVLEDGANRAIVRHTDGSLYSLPHTTTGGLPQ